KGITESEVFGLVVREVKLCCGGKPEALPIHAKLCRHAVETLHNLGALLPDMFVNGFGVHHLHRGLGCSKRKCFTSVSCGDDHMIERLHEVSFSAKSG